MGCDKVAAAGGRAAVVYVGMIRGAELVSALRMHGQSKVLLTGVAGR